MADAMVKTEMNDNLPDGNDLPIEMLPATFHHEVIFISEVIQHLLIADSVSEPLQGCAKNEEGA